jgi:hypothetical protein
MGPGWVTRFRGDPHKVSASPPPPLPAALFKRKLPVLGTTVLDPNATLEPILNSGLPVPGRTAEPAPLPPPPLSGGGVESDPPPRRRTERGGGARGGASRRPRLRIRLLRPAHFRRRGSSGHKQRSLALESGRAGGTDHRAAMAPGGTRGPTPCWALLLGGAALLLLFIMDTAAQEPSGVGEARRAGVGITARTPGRLGARGHKRRPVGNPGGRADPGRRVGGRREGQVALCPAAAAAPPPLGTVVSLASGVVWGPRPREGASAAGVAVRAPASTRAAEHWALPYAFRHRRKAVSEPMSEHLL